MTSEPQTPESDEQETMLCTSCLHPNDPDAKYCQKCGAPIGATASWGPWEQTQSEGFAIRQATTTDRPRPILVIGIWLMFLPVWIASVFVLGFAVKDKGDPLTMLFSIGVLIFSTAILYKSTANYLSHKAQQPNDDHA